jgi:Fe-S cluster assembly protein SufD
VVSVTDGAASVRQDFQVALKGENGEAFLNGVWMLKEKREAHVHVIVDHQAPNCHSNQMFKGVLDDNSRSSFEGKILVRSEAQKTDAYQLNNNLLLSNACLAQSKPNLEIFADDVKASHGSTVGQLNKEQLMYMRMRGIPEKEARALLVFGFMEQIIEMITIPSILDKAVAAAIHYLKKG